MIMTRISKKKYLNNQNGKEVASLVTLQKLEIKLEINVILALCIS